MIVLLLAAAGALAANELCRRVHEPYQGYAAEEQFVEIPQGASSPEIRRRLLDAGVVSDDLALRAALWWSGRSRRSRPASTASTSR